MRTKRPMTASLPPLRCTPEMRAKIVEVAEKQGKSIGELQRDAIDFFLSEFTTGSEQNVTPCIERAS